jgi:hypothetical protein
MGKPARGKKEERKSGGPKVGAKRRVEGKRRKEGRSAWKNRVSGASPVGFLKGL